MSHKIIASGRLVPSELEAFIRVDLFRRFRIALAILGLAAAGAIALVCWTAITEPELAASTLRNVWQGPLIFGLLVGFLMFSAKQSAQTQISSSTELAGEIRYEFDEEDMTAESEAGFSRSDWSALYEIRESKDWFVLYRSKQAFNLVPKRMFSSAGDIAAFRNLVRKELQAKAKLLSE